MQLPLQRRTRAAGPTPDTKGDQQPKQQDCSSVDVHRPFGGDHWTFESFQFMPCLVQKGKAGAPHVGAAVQALQALHGESICAWVDSCHSCSASSGWGFASLLVLGACQMSLQLVNWLQASQGQLDGCMQTLQPATAV